MDYFIWMARDEQGVCSLGELEGLDPAIRLNRGRRVADAFPDGVRIGMHPDFPDDRGLTDNLINSKMLLVVSRALKEFVEARRPAAVEYLPVAIQDHDGRVVGPDYFIIHPVDPPDCLDMEASGARMSRILRSQATSLERMVLLPDRIPPDRKLFRPKGFRKYALVARDLAEAIEAGGFGGVWFLPVDEYWKLET